MRFSHLTAMILIASLHLIVPLVLITWTLGRNYASLAAFIVQGLVLVSYTAFIFFMGSWVFASFYVRYAVLIAADVYLLNKYARRDDMSGLVESPQDINDDAAIRPAY